MRCPKCGHRNDDALVICGACDYILDTSFLGNDILNEPTRDDAGLPESFDESLGGDAVILGDPGAGDMKALMGEDTGSFLVVPTSEVRRVVLPAPMYMGADVQAMLKPEAVLRATTTSGERRSILSAFEQAVLAQIDGKRPVARLRKLVGVSGSDLRIALVMLIEKQMVELVGVVAPPPGEHAPLVDATGPVEPVAVDESIDSLASAAAAFDEDGALPPEFLDVSPFLDPALPPGVAPVPSVASTPIQTTGELDLSNLPAPEVAPDLRPALKPAMRVQPAARPKPPTPAPAVSAPAAAAPVAQPVLSSTTDPDKARQFRKLCDDDLAAGKTARAYGYAKMALSFDPENADLQALVRDWHKIQAQQKAEPSEVQLFGEAQRAEEAGDYQRAIDLLQKALKLAPKSPQLWNRLGVVLAVRLKRFSEASDALIKAIELDPANATYKNNLGKIAAMDGVGPKKESNDGLLGRLFKK